MSITPSELAVGVFSNFREAKSTLSSLRSAGFNAARMGLVVRTDTMENPDPATAPSNQERPEPLIAGELFAGLLKGELCGMLTHGLVDALVQLGIFEDEATDYKNEFVAGRALVVVRADERYPEALDLLRRNHPSTLAMHSWH